MQNRIGSCVRNTKETQIELEINLDGSGEAAVDTGIPFFDQIDLRHISGNDDLGVKAHPGQKHLHL